MNCLSSYLRISDKRTPLVGRHLVSGHFLKTPLVCGHLVRGSMSWLCSECVLIKSCHCICLWKIKQTSSTYCTYNLRSIHCILLPHREQFKVNKPIPWGWYSEVYHSCNTKLSTKSTSKVTSCKTSAVTKPIGIYQTPSWSVISKLSFS